MQSAGKKDSRRMQGIHCCRLLNKFFLPPHSSSSINRSCVSSKSDGTILADFNSSKDSNNISLHTSFLEPNSEYIAADDGGAKTNSSQFSSYTRYANLQSINAIKWKVVLRGSNRIGFTAFSHFCYTKSWHQLNRSPVQALATARPVYIVHPFQTSSYITDQLAMETSKETSKETVSSPQPGMRASYGSRRPLLQHSPVRGYSLLR